MEGLVRRHINRVWKEKKKLTPFRRNTRNLSFFGPYADRLLSLMIVKEFIFSSLFCPSCSNISIMGSKSFDGLLFKGNEVEKDAAAGLKQLV